MKKWLIVIGVLIVCVLAYWLVLPAFIDTEVQDNIPEAIAIAMESETEQDGDSTSPAVTNQSFPIIDTPGHRASGNIRVVETPEETIVRYEEYEGTNGPDLFVYLAKDLEAEEFVSLGRARGNMGNINYTVPDDVDISEYRYVMTWCRAFGVLFDYAEITE